MFFRLVSNSFVASAAVLATLSPLIGCATEQGTFERGTNDISDDRWRISSTTMNDAPAAAPATASAIVDIQPLGGSGVTGAARFRVSEGQVLLVVTLKGAPPGEHAIHIHEFGDCSDEGKAAGEHWNPTNQRHGKWGSAAFHLGDIGNVVVRPDGTATLLFKTDLWKVGGRGLRDVVGHSIVLHDHPDDFKTQPSGHAGGRIACGVIRDAGPEH